LVVFTAPRRCPHRAPNEVVEACEDEPFNSRTGLVVPPLEAGERDAGAWDSKPPAHIVTEPAFKLQAAGKITLTPVTSQDVRLRGNVRGRGREAR